MSNQIYPTGELPTNLGADTPTYDPSKLKSLVSGLSNKKVELEYDTQDPTNQRVADEVQAELQSDGLNVSVRGIPISQVFALPTEPKQAPDLLIDSTNPDASHPDTWIRIYMNTKGALNYLQCSVPAADTAMDQGLTATDPSTIATDYGKAGDLIAQSGCFDTIADVKETVVARKGYTNYVHQLPDAVHDPLRRPPVGRMTRTLMSRDVARGVASDAVAADAAVVAEVRDLHVTFRRARPTCTRCAAST